MPTTSIGPITITSEIVWNGKLAFIATDAQGFPNVYVSDGTAAGTVKVAGPFEIYGDHVGNLMALGANLLFTEGNYLWLSRGAAGDAVNATDPSLFNNSSQSVAWPTVYSGQVWFEDYTQKYGTGVYSTDGVNVYFQGNVIISGRPAQLNGNLIFPGSTSTTSGLYLANSTQVIQLSTVQPATSPVVSGSLAYFLVQSGNDWQLWISNGTSAGTKQVSVVGHNAGLVPPPALTAVGGGIMLSIDDGTHGVQPWFSNGTTAGTYILDINTQQSHTTSLPSTGPLFAVNGKVLFVEGGANATGQLWVSDGTTAGTSSIAQLGGIGLDLSTISVTIGSKTFFQVGQGDLWVTDGTNAGTVDLGAAGDLAYFPPAVVDGNLFFNATFSLKQAYGSSSITVFNHAVQWTEGAGDNVFFQSNDGDGVHGAGLYAYNAVSRVTTYLGSESLQVGSSQVEAVALGSKLIFAASPSAGSSLDLYFSDGTAAGTVQYPFGNVAGLTLDNGKVYFYSGGSTMGEGLWVTDGTQAGTTQVSTNPDNIEAIAAAGSLIYYVADSGPSWSNQLFSYDTTNGTTTLIGAGPGYGAPVVAGGVAYFAVANSSGNTLYRAAPSGGETQINPASVVAAGNLTALGSKLLYEGRDANGAWTLYVTDGTVAGTTALTAMQTDSGNNVSALTAIGSNVYFKNSDPANGFELWVTDGTVAGTHRVTDTTGGPGSANASGYVSVGSTTYFTATDGLHGQELWSFSGSGTAAMVADINAGAGDSNPTELTPFGGALYFAAAGADGVSELWKTTGSGATQITTTSNGAQVQDLTVVGTKLYFFGSDSVHGSGLFVSDGTAAGTSFLKSLSQAQAFYAVGTELYFNGAFGASGLQLWKSDGTSAGTLDVTGPTGTLADGFNGDGRSDVLIQNTAGAVVVGEAAANGAETYTTITALGSEWSFHGAGDFLGEGHSQFLIENTAGAVYVGDVTSGRASFTAVAALGSEWSFKGAGDYLADGRSDFLIENSQGLVETGEVGANGKTTYTQIGALGSEWKFVGSGDFLGEGHAQFLIENTSGAVYVGDVKGGHAAYAQVTALGSEWSFVGAGDFLGDGTSDFLIENSAGAVAIGEVGASGKASFTTVGALGPEWKFVGAGDYLGLGHDQFLIQNTAGAYVAANVQSGHAQYTQLGALGSEWSFRG